MRLDDGTTDPKSHARPVSFRGEKGIEDPVRPLDQSNAGVADRYDGLVVLARS